MGEVGERWHELQTSVALLESIIENAKEAHWAIEFIEPVDILQSRDDVIRQIFEHQSIWRMCNATMARMYGLPEGSRFKENSVRLYWPRSEENEKFVGSIIDASFSIDNALSVDRRHDGSTLYIHNDVRADIEDGRLLRIWGNVRDVTPEKEAQGRVAEVVETYGRMFDALPDAAILLASSGAILRRNRAFADSIRNAEAVERAIQRRIENLKPPPHWSRVSVVRPGGNGPRSVELYMTAVRGPEAETWILAVIREPPDRALVRRRPTAGKRP